MKNKKKPKSVRCFAAMINLMTVITFHEPLLIFSAEQRSAPAPAVEIPVKAVTLSWLEQPWDGNLQDLKTALTRQILLCKSPDPAPRVWKIAGQVLSRQNWCLQSAQAFLEGAQRASNWQEFYRYVQNNFDWYQSNGSDGQGLVKFTGYYLPSLQAQKTADEVFKFPLYSTPNNLVAVRDNNGVPTWKKRNDDGSLSDYFSRFEIDWQKVLSNQGYELVYTNSLIDLYFFQVQGSGRVWLNTPDGSPNQASIFYNFAATNGLPYVSIAKALEGRLDAKYRSLQGIKNYFNENPAELDRVLPTNPRYVFFKKAEEGPFGSSGAKLVAAHSIATDISLFPQGMVGLVRTKKPIIAQGKLLGWQDFTRFVVNQDTGGAILSPARVDIYWGEGEYAQWAAGNTNMEPGQLFFAIKK